MPATVCAHVGGDETAHVSPLTLASVADFPSIEASLGPMAGSGFVYRRNGPQNGDELAAAVAELEGAERGVATSSGMGAISATVLSLVRAGDVVVMQSDSYGGTRAFADNELARAGVEVRYVNPDNVAALDEALIGSRVALFETVSNPLLRVLDAERVLTAARSHGALSIVDNTFATPLRGRPLEAGADLVVHSATKFLGGHHDVCAGVIVGKRDLVLAARDTVVRLGLQASPLDCWLAVRGIRTLEVRLERAWANAAHLAERLAAHSRVIAVHRAERCALVSFDVGHFEAASEVVRRLEMITLSPSLGGVATTISHPATSSHRQLSAAEREATGIGEGLLRVSVGIEHADDIASELAAALG